jgi:hypothetical protein
MSKPIGAWVNLTWNDEPDSNEEHVYFSFKDSGDDDHVFFYCDVQDMDSFNEEWTIINYELEY